VASEKLCSDRCADISRQNVLTATGDPVILQDVEDKELKEPTVPIVHNGMRIYTSRNPGFQPQGVPVLTDFGAMRLAEPANQTGLLAGEYRAPEALLKLPWGTAVDIWSLGVMVSKNDEP
jgi:serine/threonine protein kinase